MTNKKQIQQYDYFETTINVELAENENPFDKNVNGTFVSPQNKKTVVSGFYDGEGIFKIRFMPEIPGEWTFSLSDGKSGEFSVIPDSAPNENSDEEGCKNRGENHGPVKVSQTYHFSYADGTRFIPIGTTCYVWQLQSPELVEQTFKTLEKSCFNKIRFCIFPKHYDYNFRDPTYFPFEGTPVDNSKINKWNFNEYNCHTSGNNWDFSRFNVKYFQYLDSIILRLQKLGIEADIILFHPYDRWGFQNMPEKINEKYLRYVTARFAAFRNIWWSMANEYDFNPLRTIGEWENLAKILVENDPYNHLKSIHNGVTFYDYTKPWISHCSIQRVDLYKCAEFTNEWREKYHKPVVLDEISYEGNIQWAWGNTTGEEIVRRCWEAAVRGGYGSHSETFVSSDDVLWWSHGGILHGESEPRVAFLKKILEEAPDNLKYKQASWDEVHAVPENDEIGEKTGYELFYYSFTRPSFRDFHLSENQKYKVEIIDTWNMSIKAAGVFSGNFRLSLPGTQYIAVRISKV